MSSLGFHPTIVERPRNKGEAIAAARAALARCQFDEGGALWRPYFFDPAGRGGWLPSPEGARGETGAAAFGWSCFGFFCSRLLRF